MILTKLNKKKRTRGSGEAEIRLATAMCAIALSLIVKKRTKMIRNRFKAL
jgi:hypothetical protein